MRFCKRFESGLADLYWATDRRRKFCAVSIFGTRHQLHQPGETPLNRTFEKVLEYLVNWSSKPSGFLTYKGANFPRALEAERAGLRGAFSFSIS